MEPRNFWFVTRPLRDPQYHADGLRALQQATTNFTKKWKGNRELHRQYEKFLADAGMKQNHISRDGSEVVHGLQCLKHIIMYTRTKKAICGLQRLLELS